MIEGVYEILLMPIICDDRKRAHLERRGDAILTGQRYCSTFIDEDMSDFAVGFYQILYGHLWGGHPMLDEKGNVQDWEFAGDTMNSFNTTANRVVGSERPPEDRWPAFLSDYHRRYHCLANFWILPMETGRTLKGELNKARRAQDYMDRYLRVIRDEAPFGGGRRFYKSFSSWDDFVYREFLRSGYLDAQGIIKPMSHGSAEDFVEKAIRAMERRARDIAESEYGDRLWDYFRENGLL